MTGREPVRSSLLQGNNPGTEKSVLQVVSNELGHRDAAAELALAEDDPCVDWLAYPYGGTALR
jgi:hypothetical protein